jgi:glycopeptide antibiotics resistance protein
LIYWGVDDDLTVIIIALSALSMYFAFDITRITRGAPRAWYVVIGGFVVLFVFRISQLYFDVQSSLDIINIDETTISLFAGVLFAIGLFMLARSFRSQQRAAQAS